MDRYEDALAAIRTAAEHLREGGAFVFKMRNYDIPYDPQAAVNAMQNPPSPLKQGLRGLEEELRQLPYDAEIYPYMEEVYDIRERLFAELRQMEEYRSNPGIREIFSEERFDALMTQYAVVLRKSV